MANKNNNGNKQGGKQKTTNRKNFKRDNDFKKDSTREMRCDRFINEENDPKWYTHNEQLIADVTKIPFNSQIGRPIQLGISKINPPAIMVLGMHDVPGIARSNMDGVNIAGQALFQKMRKDLSTYASYAQSDVTMFVLAMTDIFIRYAELTRYFGVANLYSSLNLAYSDALLNALGISPVGIQEFRANYNDYRATFNNLIYKAQSLYLPAAFPIIERKLWMYSNYFYDHDDPRAQLYVYVPDGYRKLVETGEEGTTLEFEERSETVKVMLAKFNQAIERIRSSDSMLKIMADMRNAFKDTSPWKFSYIPELYTVLPTHSTEVLSQIENTIIMPGAPDYGDTITQDVMENTTIYSPYWKDLFGYMNADSPDSAIVTLSNALYDTFINMHWKNPSSDDIIVATRNIPTAEYASVDGEAVLALSSCGSDFATHCLIYTTDQITGNTEASEVSYIVVPCDEKFIDNQPQDMSSAIPTGVLSQYVMFDWAPRLLLGHFTNNDADEYVLDVSKFSILVETDNYTVVNRDLMSRIHNNVMMSMWNVPQLGVAYN